MSLHSCSVDFTVCIQASELPLSIFDHVHSPRLTGVLTVSLRCLCCTEVSPWCQSLLILSLGPSLFSRGGPLDSSGEPTTQCHLWNFLILDGHCKSPLLFEGIDVLHHRSGLLDIRHLCDLSLALLPLKLSCLRCFFFGLQILVCVV